MVMQGVVLLIDTTPLVVKKKDMHRDTHTFDGACVPPVACESRGMPESNIHSKYI
jgi:hypothetical protein